MSGVSVLLKIAIVEDEPAAIELLKEHLSHFKSEHDLSYDVQVFRDGAAFLDGYAPIYDIVFMDIEMPNLTGTETAQRLRKIDPAVALIFVTNMAQYAINGYEVDAVDYVLKPVSYYRFASLLQKTLRRLETERDQQIAVQTPEGMRRLYLSEIAWVSVEDHLLLYHTSRGVVESWGTLTAVERNLPQKLFARCGKSCIVNLKHVNAIVGDKVLLQSQELPISRGRKKEFLAALNTYYGR